MDKIYNIKGITDIDTDHNINSINTDLNEVIDQKLNLFKKFVKNLNKELSKNGDGK